MGLECWCLWPAPTHRWQQPRQLLQWQLLLLGFASEGSIDLCWIRQPQRLQLCRPAFLVLSGPQRDRCLIRYVWIVRVVYAVYPMSILARRRPSAAVAQINGGPGSDVCKRCQSPGMTAAGVCRTYGSDQLSSRLRVQATRSRKK